MTTGVRNPSQATEQGKATRSGGFRLSAAERRDEVLRAAMAEFAQGGYAGTSTEAIAKRAGISQPYLFRLFGTKKDLFLATMESMYERIADCFRTAADGHRGVDALVEMAYAYTELLGERDLLLLQLHSFAASSDPEIRARARRSFRSLWTLAAELTGFQPEDLRPFFAQGMLMNVLAALDAGELEESWTTVCQEDPEELRTKFQASFGDRLPPTA